MITEKDKRILEVLKDHGRASTQQISKKAKIPITTVYNRMKKLENDGVIKKYSVVVANEKLGKSIAAYVLINVDYAILKKINMSQHELVKKIRACKAIDEVSMVTGEVDLIAKTRVSSVSELDKLVLSDLRTLAGVDRTKTMVILSEI